MKQDGLPELAFELVEARGALELAEASGACSEGLPLRVKELMAHLDSIVIFNISINFQARQVHEPILIYVIQKLR